MGKSTFEVSNRAMNRNASQTNIIKASQLDLKNKDVLYTILLTYYALENGCHYENAR
jgi:hypothetical protein